MLLQYPRWKSSTIKFNYLPTHYSTSKDRPTHYSTSKDSPTHYSTSKDSPTHYSTTKDSPTHYSTTKKIVTASLNQLLSLSNTRRHWLQVFNKSYTLGTASRSHIFIQNSTALPIITTMNRNNLRS